MILLTVVYEDEKEDIVNELNEVKRHFEEKNVFIGISESINEKIHFIKIFCDDEIDNKIINKFNLYIASILYKVVINEFCYDEIQKFLNDTYFFLKYEEMSDIVAKSLKILRNEEVEFDDDMIYYINKKNNIINKIKKCIEENNEINIEGFITFRMKELTADLEGIVSKVVEKYMIEKEYDEFIKLLKYFVDVQESKIEEINIIIQQDSRYLIQDKDGNDIMKEILSDLSDAKYNGAVSIEDLIISGLITYCPQKIIIHCRNNCINKEIINTIKKVFEDKVSFCDDCKMCKKIKTTVKI
ncbi:putative sporulation protein YtxC [Clostridium aestuarii]|uniref:Sporulation protein YtxC n=1 Tax=Clostridium aestuarii TaxID=338193 RepID=A0ABT4CVD4_9CLOT|nr:putative sporulation protein YtxC [Clostridium aestuarii]